MLTDSLLPHLQSVLHSDLTALQAVGGGDTHQAHALQAADGRLFFVKYATLPRAADMFRTEAQGLALLGASRVIRTPRVWAHGTAPDGPSFLLLDFIPSGQRSRLFWENFGAALANLHGNTAEKFGFAHGNFIGLLPQSNGRHDRWSEFYAAERLLPQTRLARDSGRIDVATARQVEKLCARIDRICPEESPALIHGDLWSGNFLCDRAGQPVLIDPAAAFAHREMDLGMAQLFGGFDAAFFQAYETAWPLEPGFAGRVGVYQLYYVLVHVNLFGGSYAGQARDILRAFV